MTVVVIIQVPLGQTRMHGVEEPDIMIQFRMPSFLHYLDLVTKSEKTADVFCACIACLVQRPGGGVSWLWSLFEDPRLQRGAHRDERGKCRQLEDEVKG